ncbi:hypothetical protein B4102_3289 [Heyndrickxia sporothermodurans]|uniref:Uncharacterized protein n=1 Tax=Heyndrickxia sporothermodurans TaxID=46224 RepID=A0A150KW55_9BACI|nr:hypothetical protein B4102_3289 [Heyndrickxia sporothermodurans]
MYLLIILEEISSKSRFFLTFSNLMSGNMTLFKHKKRA